MRNYFESMLANIEFTVIFSLFCTPFLYVFQHITAWTISNQDYITLVFGAILCDYFLGVWKHIRHRTFSWKKNIYGLFSKIAMVIMGAFLFEALNFLLGDGSLVGITSRVTQLVVFLFPALSAFENMSILTNGKFPPTGWIQRFRRLSQSGNLNDINHTENEEK